MQRLIIIALFVLMMLVTIFFFTRQSRLRELSHAASIGDLATVKRCLWLGRLGVDIESTPEYDGGANSGEPAFIAAAFGGHDDVILFLLNHHANINRQDSCGNTALNVAVSRGHFSTVKLLLSNGANPNLRGEGSPLEGAENRGDTNMLAILKSHGASK